jgi:hypothetical protein
LATNSPVHANLLQVVGWHGQWSPGIEGKLSNPVAFGAEIFSVELTGGGGGGGVKEVFDCSTIIEEIQVPRVAKLQLT